MPQRISIRRRHILEKIEQKSQKFHQNENKSHNESSTEITVDRFLVKAFFDKANTAINNANNFDEYEAKCKDVVDKIFAKCNVLVHYVRKQKGRKIKKGVVVAFKDSQNKIHIGWSLCKLTGKRKEPRFSKYIGLWVALNRANTLSEIQKEIPHSVDNVVNLMIMRALKCFHGIKSNPEQSFALRQMAKEGQENTRFPKTF